MFRTFIQFDRAEKIKIATCLITTFVSISLAIPPVFVAMPTEVVIHGDHLHNVGGSMPIWIQTFFVASAVAITGMMYVIARNVYNEAAQRIALVPQRVKA